MVSQMMHFPSQEQQEQDTMTHFDDVDMSMVE